MKSSAVIVYQDDLLENDPVLEKHTDPIETELVYDDDDPNLVTTFMRSTKGREALERIVDHMLTEYKQAWEDSADWRDRWMRDWKLFAGELPPKEGMLRDCTNANIPISLENTSRVALRLFSEIFGDFKGVFSVVGLQRDDALAEALTKHGNWQIRNDIPDFERQMHRAVMAFTHIGDWTCHSYYDVAQKRNRHEILTPDEFVVPWANSTTATDYGDLPWYAKICSLYTHEIEQRRDVWHGVDDLLQEYQSSSDDEPDQPAAEEINELQGHSKPASTKHAAWKIIWWEGYINLPGQKDQRFVQAQIHEESRKILLLRIQEEPHWKDRQEYDRKMDERDGYAQALSAYEEQFAAAAEPFDRADEYVDLMADEEMVDPEVALEGMQAVDEQRQQVLGQLQEPAMPAWMGGDSAMIPDRPKTVPVRLFTHAVCLEPLVGNRGLSYGRIQADLQRAVNALMSQYIDSATFANAGCFVSTGKLDFKKELTIAPGYVNKTDSRDVDDIRKHFMPLSMPGANQQLFEVANLLMGKAQSSMQASEILSGIPGKSGETGVGVTSRIEQAVSQLSVLARKMAAPLRQIFLNNAYLNSIFLPESEIVRISDIEGRPEIQVGRHMYARNYDVEITSDLSFKTRAQKIAEADELAGSVMGLAATPESPLFGNLAIQYAAIKGSLEARSRKDLVAMLGAPPPPPAQFGPPQLPPPTPPGAPPGGPPGAPPRGPPPSGMGGPQ